MSSFFTNKTVVVTGAAGFVGSHLVDALLGAGATVIGVDNLITGREENIAHLFEESLDELRTMRDASSQPLTPKHDNYLFVTGDAIQSPITYLQADAEIDVFFHLASPASPPRYQEHPVETYLVNSLGMHHILDFIKSTQQDTRVVYASTSESYGDPKVHPQPETYWGNVNPNGPRACYDESKRLGESICGVFNRDFGVDVRIARIFNTYGPRMDPADGRVIPNFVMQALQQQPLTIYGDGSQTRSYCYVSDLVAGLMKLASVDQASGETINLGNPDEYTITETAEVIMKAAGTETELTYKDLPKDDPTRRQPDITKAKQILDWQPTVTFDDGLAKTIAHFSEHEL